MIEKTILICMCMNLCDLPTCLCDAFLYVKHDCVYKHMYEDEN